MPHKPVDITSSNSYWFELVVTYLQASAHRLKMFHCWELYPIFIIGWEWVVQSWEISQRKVSSNLGSWEIWSIEQWDPWPGRNTQRSQQKCTFLTTIQECNADVNPAWKKLPIFNCVQYRRNANVQSKIIISNHTNQSQLSGTEHYCLLIICISSVQLYTLLLDKILWKTYKKSFKLLRVCNFEIKYDPEAMAAAFCFTFYPALAGVGGYRKMDHFSFCFQPKVQEDQSTKTEELSGT